MTPKHLFLVLISLFTIEAQADVIPGIRPIPSYPGSVRPAPRPEPGRPLPPRPEPGRPVPPRPVPPRPVPPSPYPPQPSVITRTIFIGRNVVNEVLPLRQLAGIGSEFQGYELESVRMNVLGGAYGTVAELLINNQVEDSLVNPMGSVYLRPRYSRTIGYDSQSLRLRVAGQLNVDRIDITLRETYQPGPGADVSLPIQLQRRMFNGDRVDVSSYVDLWNYQGYRIQAIEIDGQAYYNNGTMIDVLANSFLVGSVMLDPYSSSVLYPTNSLVIGRNADSLVLIARGDALIRSVTLHLTRY